MENKMKRYKTFKEAKEHLPEIVDRIDDCKAKFNSCSKILEKIQHWCVEEAIDPNKNYGWWTTPSAYAKYVRAQIGYFCEIDYLQKIVDNIKIHSKYS